ncbi:hypothetical protein IG631_17456 [Alternaria alternata]|nr:hypothetical protein IG631_17456 [Alternaria alternata]
MKRSENNGRYILQNELRTWSELKRRAAKEKEETKSATSSTPSRATPLTGLGQTGATSSPTIPTRRWGGCVNGCDHDKINYPRRPMRKNTMEYMGHQSQQLPPPAVTHMEPVESEQEDHPVAAPQTEHAPIINEPSPAKLSRKQSTKNIPEMPPTPASPNDASNDATSSEGEEAASSLSRSGNHAQPRTAAVLRHLQPHKTPGEGFSDDSDYFPGMQQVHHRKFLRASSTQRKQSKERKLQRKQTEQSWKEESGMGNGARTDRLGDGDATSDDAAFAKEKEGEPILVEALKGNMIVEKSEEEREANDEFGNTETKIGETEIDKMQDAERKGFGEVY